MRIYIAHAAADNQTARGTASALASEGHSVVHPSGDSANGGDHERALKNANFLVYLVSPESIAPGAQSLSDFFAFQKRWRNPRERILPVYVKPVSQDALPAAIQKLEAHQPQGNILADISNLIAKRRAPSLRRRKIGAAAATAILVATASYYLLNRPVSTVIIETQDFIVTNADQFVYWGSKPKYGLKLDRPGATLDYTCELGKPTGPNLVNASSSIEKQSGKKLCKSIDVEIAAGPFEGVTEDGFQPAGTVPYVIKDASSAVLKTSTFDVVMSNTSMMLRLEGLERASDLGWGGYYVSPGVTHVVKVINDGNPLLPPYVCAIAVDSGSVKSDPSGNGCVFELVEAGGSLKVTVTGTKPKPKLFAAFQLVSK